MNLNIYLTFDGNAREAMTFYKECLGGELQLMTFADAKVECAPEAKDKIIHAALMNGPAVIMASDTMPGMPLTRGDNFSICLHCESAAGQDRLFASLAKGGKVTMDLQDTFWNARFGTLVDRFGINWMFNFDKSGKACGSV